VYSLTGVGQNIASNVLTTLIWKNQVVGALPGMNFLTGIFTVPSTAFYIINVTITFAAAGGSFRRLDLVLPAAQMPFTPSDYRQDDHISNPVNHHASVSWAGPMAAGEVVSVAALQDDPGVVTVSLNTTALTIVRQN
jgi:hypothetical protein